MKRQNQIPKRLLQLLRKKSNKKFLLLTHIHREADALGSELALGSLLRALGKKVVILNEGEPVREHAFLPGIGKIRHHLPKGSDYDCAIVVDCSDISRAGKAVKFLRPDRTLINIDHHVSNSRFADINWVESRASCACEMIFELFRAFKVKVGKADAVCLYAGIVTDTGSFAYANTSAATHRIAGELLRTGLDAYQIHRELYESKTILEIKAYGRIIKTLKTTPDGKVAWMQIDQRQLTCEPSLLYQTDTIISFARSIQGVQIVLLFKEVPGKGEVRVNLRSCRRVDVNRLARLFGGGGHKMASGCTLKGRLGGVVKKVVEAAQERVT